SKQFGVPGQLMIDLGANIGRTEVEEQVKPILQDLRKLTRTPTRLTYGDADAVFAAGSTTVPTTTTAPARRDTHRAHGLPGRLGGTRRIAAAQVKRFFRCRLPSPVVR
ncbi:MAG: hypothetical protein ACRD0W_20185, partial [Acidimicrobiales bacterium]